MKKFKSYSRISKKFIELGIPQVEVPNLLSMQVDSFEDFIQKDVHPQQRTNFGLQAVFENLFPITDPKENYELEFVEYRILKEKYSIDECIERNLSYQVPLKIKLRLKVYEVEEDESFDIIVDSVGSNKNDVKQFLITGLNWDEVSATNILEAVETNEDTNRIINSCDEAEDAKQILNTLKTFGVTGRIQKRIDKTRTLRDIMEQEVFLGDIPLITEQGTFVINGAERVIISQLQRSPGVYFSEEKHPSGKMLISSKIIPYNGSWLEFHIDIHDVVYVNIDKRRKLPVTILLRSVGYIPDNYAEIPEARETLRLSDEKGNVSLKAKNSYAYADVYDPREGHEGKIIVKAKTKLNNELVEELLSAGVIEIDTINNKYISTDTVLRERFYDIEEIPTKKAEKRFTAYEIIGPKGQLLVEPNTEIDKDIITELTDLGINSVKVVSEECDFNRKILEKTLLKDPTRNQEEAAQKIYSLVRPGEDEVPIENAMDLIDKMFFNSKRYNLGNVGRHKLNAKLDFEPDYGTNVLTQRDFTEIIQYMISIFKDEKDVDDIDHLANRRVRTVGELLEEQYKTGLSMIARIALERMAIANPDEVTVHDLINSNALITVIDSFFLTGQLSQFMDQTNPLSALTHKRRLSALGPGGLARDRAGFEVRDIHYSHYGRICPIETPEGPSIGLLNSPAIYSRINKFGFLETPYIKVENGVITSRVDYLDAHEEDKYIIAQHVNIDDDLVIKDKYIFAREKDEYVNATPEQIDYLDVSPQQVVSVSAALVPFLEHDDANRALMGSNMQRQSVPLLNPQSPIIGTGIEKIVARESGAVVLAPYNGQVAAVTSEYIDLKPDLDSNDIDLITEERIYLKKYVRSNQDTCINQRPIVAVGDKVQKGQPISDGPGIEGDRLALGTNMVVAFMPWYGYNYEDAIILSEHVARKDTLTSIYIEELEVLVRDLKNGKEELASDIPNVPVNSLRNLDKSGIIRVGSVITAGDVIVGKITPKSVEIDPSPEENLMRALFGDRAGDYTNSSLKAKPGMEGVVLDVKVFSRYEDIIEFEEDHKSQIAKLKKDNIERKKKIESFKKDKLSELLIGQVAKNIVDSKDGRFYIISGKKITASDLEKINFTRVNLDVEMVADPDKYREIYKTVALKVNEAMEESENIYKKSRDRIKHGDELPYGVRKMVKVYIAKKRKIQVGDKMAGRHGNKGVISIVAPIEDMPFLSDGTPVDIVLNPLGVPSRMNIGQIMETHLGMAAKTLGFYVETPIFDGAKIEDIEAELKEANLPTDGKQVLYDGKTGEPFKERVTVGVMYMMKLNHLVADKMHARSTGPYSLITQQPLGGKAQHGGQRLGEMEVWALEAYGAAHLLEEMLTIKSDDVDGRTNAFKAITNGQNPPAPGTPESFNVLISELKSLAFDIEFLKDE
ncbi:DNA-directed RNA polymerase subunit beta [bacterium]|nr:DNA-directed RNA polymerase subunit beta [bacterium]